MTDTVRVPRAWLEAFRRDTDPTEPIADNGGTVWDMFCHEAAAMLAASPQGEGSSADADTHRAAEGGVVEALRSVSAWLYSWGQHVGSCRGGGVCTCGLTAMREQGTVALDAVNRVTEGVK